MANNRLWLVHRPSGAAVFLGKRMAFGWYQNMGETIEGRLDAFFSEACDVSDLKSQDDFILVMEDAENAPACTEHWTWDEERWRPKLKKSTAK